MLEYLYLAKWDQTFGFLTAGSQGVAAMHSTTTRDQAAHAPVQHALTGW